jgi:hypothetical protein
MKRISPVRTSGFGVDMRGGQTVPPLRTVRLRFLRQPVFPSPTPQRRYADFSDIFISGTGLARCTTLRCEHTSRTGRVLFSYPFLLHRQ